MAKPVEQLIRFAASSRKGARYGENEDSFLALPECNVFAVADGMGGHNGGAVASTMLVEYLVRRLSRLSGELHKDAVLDVIREANYTIYKRTELESQLEGMGSTLSLLHIDNDVVNCFQIGDSRIYQCFEFVTTQLTNDHTTEPSDIGQMIDTPLSSRGVTRAVGVKPEVRVDHYCFNHTVGAEYLIVSDGISDVLPNYKITNIVSEVMMSHRQRVDRLLDAAEASGGSDDKTAVLVAPDV